MTLGGRLRELRVARGWTQQELADASGVIQSTISRLERGIETNPGLQVLEGLAHAFGLTVGELLEHQEEELTSPHA